MLVTPPDTKVDLGLLINLTSAQLEINRVCAWAVFAWAVSKNQVKSKCETLKKYPRHL